MSADGSRDVVVPSEAGPSGPVTGIEVLAAVARAELHAARRRRVVMDPNIRDVAGHLGWRYSSASTRRLRPHLAELVGDGLLETKRSHPRHVRLNERWSLTARGRRRLATAGVPTLPESPQHRRWRHSQEAARHALDGLRRRVQAAVAAASALSKDEGPGGALRDDWARERVESEFARATRVLASALRMLDEWPEPGEGERDGHVVRGVEDIRAFIRTGEIDE
jgi:hypothetical protein